MKNSTVVSLLILTLAVFLDCKGRDEWRTDTYQEALVMKSIPMKRRSIFELFDLPYDSISADDSASQQLPRLDSLFALLEAMKRYRFLKDAWYVKSYVWQYCGMNSEMPASVDSVGLNRIMLLDHTNREYFSKILSFYCYLGTNGDDQEWNRPLDEIIHFVDTAALPLYFADDDMMIKLRVQENTGSAK
jgi:hypothetical protein